MNTYMNQRMPKIGFAIFGRLIKKKKYFKTRSTFSYHYSLLIENEQTCHFRVH